MERREDELPTPVDVFPDDPLEFSFVARIQRLESVREVWIPRFTSVEQADCDEDDVLELGIGVIPTTGIETVILDRAGVIATFRFDDGWILSDVRDRDAVDSQVFAYQMKPYVAVHRVLSRLGAPWE